MLAQVNGYANEIRRKYPRLCRTKNQHPVQQLIQRVPQRRLQCRNDNNGRDNRVSYQDRNKNTWSYEYDDFGNVISMTNPLGHSTIIEYNTRNHPTLVKRPNSADELGNTTKFEYTLTGQLHRAIDALGYETAYKYDDCDRLNVKNHLGEIRVESDAAGKVLGIRNHVDKVVEYAYEKGGELENFTYPGGKTVKYEYDSVMNLTKINDGTQSVSYYYDSEDENSDGYLTKKLFDSGAGSKY